MGKSEEQQITVVIPMYNAARYIRDAIDSILNQTYSDFILLIIDDGSTDESVDIVNAYDDSRIRLVRNEQNKGLIYTLNRAFSLVTTKYLIRQDADDLSDKSRVQKLYSFMERHLEVVICSSWFSYFGAMNRTIEQAIEDADIKIKALSRCPLTHGAAIFRVKQFLENDLAYDFQFKHAEDYEMLTRACTRVNMYNIPEVLYFYRTHEDQICTRYSNEQLAQDDVIRLKYLKETLHIELTDRRATEIHFKLIQPLISRTMNEELAALFEWRDELIRKNNEVCFFDSKKFKEFIESNLRMVVSIRRKYAPSLIVDLNKIRVKYGFTLGWRRTLIFIIRCLTFTEK